MWLQTAGLNDETQIRNSYFFSIDLLCIKPYLILHNFFLNDDY